MLDAPQTGEFDLIRWFRERTRSNAPATVLGIGDDCAILRFTPGADLVVTTDMLMDGRHFVLDRVGGEAAGFKAIAVSVSDIAAMAAKPVAAVVALALPRQNGQAAAIGRALHAGFSDAASRFGVAIVGGDTNAWDGPLVVSVTLIGEALPKGAVRRSGAKAGDAILVTGPLGGSLLGRHLRPTPRVAEAIALHESTEIHALIDLSDGLSSDLNHILEESEGNLGAILDAGSIPIHPDARTFSRSDGRSPIDHAFHDGEDFELCLVVSSVDADRLLSNPPAPAQLWKVGLIHNEPGLWLRHADGTLTPIPPAGFDHLKG